MKKLFTLVLLALGSNSFAWGPLGHKVVGEIATLNLTPKAKQSVQKLLNNGSLTELATWADVIKNEGKYAKTKTWHYVTIEDGDSYEQSEKNPQGDVVTAIEEAVSTLKDSAKTKEDQVDALKFLIHFVGDIHQPLHVGRGVDRGGNEIDVNFMGRQQNLHAIWDTGMVDSQQLGVAELARKLQGQKGNQTITEFNFLEVVKENMNLRKQVYAFKNSSIDQNYMNQNLSALNSRLLLGGKRLAFILNSVYK